jgi:TMEM175 potassium channel family protein
MSVMRTGRGFERLITFTDAVVAIALTLLVLPLVEIAGQARGDESVGRVLSDHADQISAFVVSFVVIWGLWTLHHRTMEYFDGYDPAIMRLTLLWLFTIVVLPFTTQLLNSEAYGHGAAPVYIGVLLVSALSLFGVSWWGRRHRGLLLADRREVDDWVNEPRSLTTVGIMLVAFVLSIAFPPVGVWPLLALLFTDAIDRAVLRLRGRVRRHG